MKSTFTRSATAALLAFAALAGTAMAETRGPNHLYGEAALRLDPAGADVAPSAARALRPADVAARVNGEAANSIEGLMAANAAAPGVEKRADVRNEARIWANAHQGEGGSRTRTEDHARLMKQGAAGSQAAGTL
jgi:hypothetical protein